jgi:hypothetical protein
MGEAFKSEVRLPVWLVTLLISMMLSLLVYSSTVGAQTKQVELNTKAITELKNNDIKNLEEKKADKEIVNQIYSTLNRIENKLDGHIAQK